MKWIAFLLWILSAQQICGQESDVLFIGNSYTYFWNLPQVVSAIGQEQGVQINTRQSTAGGANLGQHWNNQKELQSHEVLSSNEWDYVVLQDHSLRAIQYPDSLEHYVGLWVDAIKEIGAQPILYMTWARQYDPTMISDIATKYEELAVQYDIGIVPVGRIWQRAKDLRPDIRLYDPDQSHPSPLGTYLTACAFYSALTGHSARDIPARLKGKDQYGENLYLLIVSPQDAQFCQSIVDSVMSTYGKD